MTITPRSRSRGTVIRPLLMARKYIYGVDATTEKSATHCIALTQVTHGLKSLSLFVPNKSKLFFYLTLMIPKIDLVFDFEYRACN